ncbi:MAG: hypothetical protein ACU0DW_03020 [Shimia sp.]
MPQFLAPLMCLAAPAKSVLAGAAITAVALSAGGYLQSKASLASAHPPVPEIIIAEPSDTPTALFAHEREVISPLSELTALPVTLGPRAPVALDVKEQPVAAARSPDLIFEAAPLATSDAVTRVSETPPGASPLVRSTDPACTPFLLGRPTTGAMVQLLISAPCNKLDALTIHHEGLMFTATTDGTGTASVELPALTEEGTYMAAFAGGETAQTQITVSEVNAYDRVVVQWEGEIGFQLHAFERGAMFGDPGHIWVERPQDVTRVTSGEGGFLKRLGQFGGPGSRFADVYSSPRDPSFDIDLSVEAEVTATNCDTDIDAQTITGLTAGAAKIVDLALSMPGCDAVGEVLVLKNIL